MLASWKFFITRIVCTDSASSFLDGIDLFEITEPFVKSVESAESELFGLWAIVDGLENGSMASGGVSGLWCTIKVKTYGSMLEGFRVFPVEKSLFTFGTLSADEIRLLSFRGLFRPPQRGQRDNNGVGLTAERSWTHWYTFHYDRGARTIVFDTFSWTWSIHVSVLQ